ncbi:MAG: vitamin K epoxide reductase family protein [Gemmatimonadaceae bacterium]|nr:vitamin K epoxide reductase family protein [Gemmatimonadaceae bacterium]
MTPEKGIILVTGSNGLIGQAVMRRFVGRFTDVVGFDRKAPAPPPPGCVHVAVEITSDESVREGLRMIRAHHGERIASVIHLAAYYDFFGEPSPKYEEITVQGTGRLLRELRAQGFQIEQFVFSSTMLVHRPGEPGEFITEDWPLEPTWAYPESKVRTEQIIHDGRGDIRTVLLRISGVYDDLTHSIPLAHQIQRIYQRDLTSRVYSGSTAHGQSFMHMDDLIDAIELVVERRTALPPEVPILLGEPEALSYDELQHTIERLIRETSKETIEIPGALAPVAKAGAWVLDHVPGQEGFIKPWMIDRANDHYDLDITRARTLLGWEPKRSLRETLPKMVAALKADPLGWYRENKLEPPSELEKTAGKSEAPHQADHAGHAPMAMAHGQGAPWAHFANMTLGLWLITSAFALGYRSTALQLSDVVSGALVIMLAALSLSRRPFWKLWAPWANSLVGLWLLFAPLVFWAPTAAAYSNDTLVGALVVVFAILAPGMPMPPGMSMEPGPDVPPGWSYNPSSWPQRAPIIALALVGFFLSRQMAAFELGHVTTLTDPFFRMGTERVLTSDVSRAFPIPDAGLGAIAYMVEFLMGFMGDKRRWRTMPWMVTFFGILVVPLGIVSITLIILQPLAVGAWCTPCLIAAVAMLIMIALTLDEVVAMGQFLVQARREGQPFWRVFWLGGTLRDLPEVGPTRADVVSAKAMVWGVALPWNLLLCAGLGVWLMFTPSVLGSAGTAAHSDHLFGALIVTIAVIALADVGRAARFVNLFLGAWIIAAPWLLAGASSASTWSDAIAGAVVILLSFPRGRVGERYGTWERFIR